MSVTDTFKALKQQKPELTIEILTNCRINFDEINVFGDREEVKVEEVKVERPKPKPMNFKHDHNKCMCTKAHNCILHIGQKPKSRGASSAVAKRATSKHSSVRK